MKVWNCGDFIDMEIGQEVTVFTCSSGRTVFGEPGKLVRVTAQHLVFVTDSGATIKTAIDNIHTVVGRAKENSYGVAVREYSSFTNIIHEEIRFWDKKTCKFVKK